MLPIKTILHPTDFSERSEHAFRLACDLAADYGANLVLVHVVRQPVIAGDGVILPSADEMDGTSRNGTNGFEVPDGVAVRKIDEGRPAVEILQLAQLCQADLIVMGTHARRGLPRLALGSVAEEVVRRATCPVLTVAAPVRESSNRNSNSLAVLSCEPSRPSTLPTA